MGRAGRRSCYVEVNWSAHLWIKYCKNVAEIILGCFGV